MIGRGRVGYLEQKYASSRGPGRPAARRKGQPRQAGPVAHVV